MNEIYFDSKIGIAGFGGFCQGKSIEAALNYAIEWPILEASSFNHYSFLIDVAESTSKNSYKIDEWQFVRENNARDVKAML